MVSRRDNTRVASPPRRPVDVESVAIGWPQGSLYSLVCFDQQAVDVFNEWNKSGRMVNVCERADAETGTFTREGELVGTS